MLLERYFRLKISNNWHIKLQFFFETVCVNVELFIFFNARTRQASSLSL